MISVDPDGRKLMEKIMCGSIHEVPKGYELKNFNDVAQRPTRVGRGDAGGSILICGQRKSYFPFQCFVGPDWPMLVCVYGTILTANLTLLPIIAYLGWPVIVIGTLGFVGLLYFYSAVACSDPGIIFDEDLDSPAPSQREVSSQSLSSPSQLVIQGVRADASMIQNASVVVQGTIIKSSSISSMNIVPSSVRIDVENQGGNSLSNSDEDPHILSGTASLLGHSHDSQTIKSHDSQPIISNSSNIIVGSSQPENLDLEANNHRKVSPHVQPLISTVPSKSNNGRIPEIECGQCEIKRPYSAR
jgi:hypothetical protein